MKEFLLKYKDFLLRYAKYTKYAGFGSYSVFYVFCVILFLPLTFPYDRLKERVVGSFNAAQFASGGQLELQIDDMGGYWLSGVKMKGVRLVSAPVAPGTAAGKIEIEQATVRYGILPMLVGNSDMGFDVDAFGGEASGSYEVHGKDNSVDVALEAIDLGKVEPLVLLLGGAPLQGKLDGTVHLTMPEGKASKESGTVSLEAKDVALGDDRTKIKGALTLPRISIGTLTFAAEAKDGVMKITKFVAGGKDLEIQGDGRITLRELAMESLCDIGVRFRINDVYRAKNDITKSLFGAPGSSAPALFELADPKVKQSKRADGFYSWSARGPLGRLEFIPKG